MFDAPRHVRRPIRTLMLLLAMSAGAACSESGSPVSPEGPVFRPTPDPATALGASLTCQVDVRARSLACAPTSPASAAAGNARLARIIGGQSTNVRLASTNVAYDSVSQLFAFDVTVENLMVQRIGTSGAGEAGAPEGVRIFFHSSPAPVEGGGVIRVATPDGMGDFTGSAQPYYLYPGALSYRAVSAPRRWSLNVPRSVTRFAFQLYLSAPMLPVVVFDRVENGNRDIYRVGLDGGDLVRLTTHAGDDQNPTVAKGRVVFTSFRDGNAELYSIGLLGGTEQRLTRTAANELDPALSPDGTRLAYTTDATGVNKLWKANADGTGAVPAAPGFGFNGSIDASPNWVPGAERLAFVSTTNGSADIFALTLGAAPTLLVGGQAADVEPAWSTDGARLAFASNRSGDTEIYVLTVATGALVQLTSRVGSDANPTWLEDGRIVFTSFEGSTPRLRWVDPSVPGVLHDIPTGTGAAGRPAAVTN